MAKPSQVPSLPRVLVVELWGLGDLALAVPFLQSAAGRADVTLLAKPHAAPLLARFAPHIEHIPLTAPWTAFAGKYRLLRWPWHELARTRRALRAKRFLLGLSARPDPRDHALLAIAGARRRLGFSRTGSGFFLTETIAPPPRRHRAAHWQALAEALGWALPANQPTPRAGRRVVIHTGAARPVRRWPRDRFEVLAAHLRTSGWEVTILDDSLTDLTALLAALERADRFIGNDSGPGHLAALLGVPTFTIFGPQLPELFSPQHPDAAWLAGAPCPHKPCFDSCRFAEPNCLLALSAEFAWPRVKQWLDRTAQVENQPSPNRPPVSAA